MDVLSLSAPDDLIVWYENLDGLGDFSNQKIISDTEDGIYEIIASDLDGDSDADGDSLSAQEESDHAEDDSPRFRPRLTHQVERATSEIKIDGLLEEQAWRDAAEIEVNLEYFPGENIVPPVQTMAFMTYDDRNIYVAFKCYDPNPERIRAHLMKRDEINTFVQDDHITIMLDTFNDERRAFQFRVNPLGVQADAIFSESEGAEDFSWDIIWTSAGRRDAEEGRQEGAHVIAHRADPVLALRRRPRHDDHVPAFQIRHRRQQRRIGGPIEILCPLDRRKRVADADPRIRGKGRVQRRAHRGPGETRHRRAQRRQHALWPRRRHSAASP